MSRRWIIILAFCCVAILFGVYIRATNTVAPFRKQLVLNHEQVEQLYEYVQPEWQTQARQLQGNQYAGVLLTIQEACVKFFIESGRNDPGSLTITLEGAGRAGHVRWSFPAPNQELRTGERAWSARAVQRAVSYLDSWQR